MFSRGQVLPVQLPSPSTPAEQYLYAILQTILSQIPKGIVYSYQETVSALALPRLDIEPKLFTIVLINDGPLGAIQYQIPSNSNNWVTINPTEVHTHSFQTGVIGSINRRMVTVPAAWRIIGTY